MSANGWNTYIERTKGIPPRPLLVESLQYVQGRKALDLGAGPMNDARYLMSKGFEVLAVDSNPNARTEDVPFAHASFEDFVFPKEAYDLVSAQYALPFTKPDAFPKVFEGIQQSLKEGGVFTGQLFGPRDGFAGAKTMTFLEREEVERLFSGFEILKLEEEESDKESAIGEMKHWHIFYVIARKR